MNRKQWLRGLAVSLSVTGINGLSYGQNYAPQGSGLAPSSYPTTYLPAYPNIPQPPLVIGSGYPYLAQNTSPQPNSGHVHVPHGNYTATGQPSSVPSVSGNPSSIQPSHTAPLPPIDPQYPVQSSHTSSAPTTAPMYQVPTQQYTPQTYSAPQAVPMTQPLYQNAPIVSGETSAPCQSCTPSQGSVWNGYDGQTSQSSCGGPSCYSGISTGYAGGVVSPKPWIFGGNALIFDRIDNDYTRLSSNFTNNGPSVLNVSDARMDHAAGFEAFGGRYFGCGKYALIGSYWGLFPSDETRIVYDAELNPKSAAAGDYLQSNIPFRKFGPEAIPVASGIRMPGGGPTIDDWYARAYAHRLIRSQDFNNVEINLLGFGLGGAARHGVLDTCSTGCGTSGGWANGKIGRGGLGLGGSQDCGTCTTACPTGCSGPCAPITGAQCSPLRFNWLGGFRWFRFGDYMEYAASNEDATFGGADDIYYRNTVQNDLVGAQIGGRLTYCTGRRFHTYAGTKFGVFGNRITHQTFAGSTTTAAEVYSSNPYNGLSYDFDNSTTELALLGEGELGLGIRLSPCWTANAGYRLMGVSGIATAPGQIPADFTLTNDAQRIRNHDSLILHGVSFGAMYNW